MVKTTAEDRDTMGKLISGLNKAAEEDNRELALDEDDHDDPIKITVIKRSIKELMNALQRAEDMSGAYKDAVKEVARKANVKPGVLGQYIKQRHADKLDEMKKKLAQMQMLLDL